MQIFISILLLIGVLALIVLVHELGHFLVAKWCGIRVDEFGLGFPPRAVKLFSYQGTDYTLNWIPFGGFVKIYGEDSLDKNDPDFKRSLIAKKWWQQIAVLAAGVTMNVILAWVIFSGMLMAGAPTLASQTDHPELLKDVQLTVLDVAPNSPAATAGIATGDVVTKIASNKSILVNPDVAAFTTFIQSGTEQDAITVSVTRGDTVKDIVLTPKTGIVADHVAIGVAVDQVGYQPGLSFFTSLSQGFTTTVRVVESTGQAFVRLISGNVNLNTISGPVGLTKIIGEAEQVGFTSLLMVIAIISVNLAIINILPFPALDGGRIVFVIIEAIIRRPLPKKFVEWVNGAGFVLLLLLMLVITVKDVIKLL
ncbi:MAG: M50 family metallopeptidase [bacterium]